MTKLIGQIKFGGIAVTGAVKLRQVNYSVEFNVLNGYFKSVEVSPGLCTALIIPNVPNGVIPEVTFTVPDQEVYEWGSGLSTKKERQIAIALKPPSQMPLDKKYVNRLSRLPPPENLRGDTGEIPDYWDKEESVIHDNEELLVAELDNEEEEKEPPIDRRTSQLIKLASRLRK